MHKNTSKTEHTSISQPPQHGQSYNVQRKKTQNDSQGKKWENRKTTDCTKYKHKHIIK